MARIFYLNIDTGASEVKIRATQLHTEFHNEGPTGLDQERFQELYREVATVPGDDPDEVFEGFLAEAESGLVDADERGMEVGDIIQLEDTSHVYVPEGWQEITITD
jgi:hypothetical protein